MFFNWQYSGLNRATAPRRYFTYTSQIFREETHDDFAIVCSSGLALLLLELEDGLRQISASFFQRRLGFI